MRFPEFSVNHLHSLWRFTTTTYSSMWRHDFHVLRTYNLSSRSIVASLEPGDYNTQSVLNLKFSMRWEIGKLETGDITATVVYVRPNILPRSLTILRKTNDLRSHRDKIPLSCQHWARVRAQTKLMQCKAWDEATLVRPYVVRKPRSNCIRTTYHRLGSQQLSRTCSHTFTRLGAAYVAASWLGNTD
jgi:hypothetical protein